MYCWPGPVCHLSITSVLSPTPSDTRFRLRSNVMKLLWEQSHDMCMIQDQIDIRLASNYGLSIKACCSCYDPPCADRTIVCYVLKATFDTAYKPQSLYHLD